ncbi:Bgr_08870 family protein, partial [Bartonella refiksaydamii]|uniref:Bgr_08870 family protein n=1 Tax=Bartonella refiksaydamii TaxID=2654951 RepID=UPI0012EBEE36
IDQAIVDIEDKLDEKAPLKHTHTISDVTDLEATLKGKMAADKTFTFADLSDIEGAKDAANNYVLYKSSNNNFTFGSAISLLGAHQHKTEDIVGFDAEGIASYGRLSQTNEWQNHNIFKGKVSLFNDLELTNQASLTLKKNGTIVTDLNTEGSLLKGPATIDGKEIYTKAEAVLALQGIRDEITKEIKSFVPTPLEILMTESGPIPIPNGVTDDTYIEVWAWGGGGGNYKGGGGGGGGCVHIKIKWSRLKDSKNVLIGRGGKGFYTGQPKDFAGYGGFTRILDSTIAGGGGGGAVNGHNSTGAVGGVSGNSLGGLGGGYSSNSSSSNGRDSTFNGGGGGSYGEKSGTGGNGGNSILGGGGGASGDSSAQVQGGLSVKGGNGGGSYNNKSGGGGGYFPGKSGDHGGDGGDGAVSFKFYI